MRFCAYLQQNDVGRGKKVRRYMGKVRFQTGHVLLYTNSQVELNDVTAHLAKLFTHLNTASPQLHAEAQTKVTPRKHISALIVES